MVCRAAREIEFNAVALQRETGSMREPADVTYIMNETYKNKFTSLTAIVSNQTFEANGHF